MFDEYTLKTICENVDNQTLLKMPIDKKSVEIVDQVARERVHNLCSSIPKNGSWINTLKEIENSDHIVISDNEWVEIFVQPDFAWEPFTCANGETVAWDIDDDSNRPEKNRTNPMIESVVFSGTIMGDAYIEPRVKCKNHSKCKELFDKYLDLLEDDESPDEYCVYNLRLCGGSNILPVKGGCCWECDVLDCDNQNDIIWTVGEKTANIYTYNYCIEITTNEFFQLFENIKQRCQIEY